jgi:hypothetical protein
MKKYVRLKVKLPVFLTLALDEGNWAASHSWSFKFPPPPTSLRENSHRYPLGKELGGPRTELDAVENRNAPAPARNRIPVVELVTSHFADWPTPHYEVM